MIQLPHSKHSEGVDDQNIFTEAPQNKFGSFLDIANIFLTNLKKKITTP